MESPWELLIYLVLAGVTALVAVAFIKSLYAFEDFADRLPIRPWLLTPIGGLIIGLMGLRFPEIFGVGYEAINEALSGNLAIGMLVALLGVKLLATGITIASGGSGGVFAPLLFLGSMAGGFVGVLANQLFPGMTAAPGAYALVGMGAVVAGATHAPITAILIIFELTNDYQLIVPLMGTCIIATLATTRLKPQSIYTLKLLRRGIDISAGRELNVLRSAFMHADSLRGLVNAADLLRTDVPAVTPDQDLDTVMRIFGGKNREELPVVDTQSGRKLVGIITRDHLLEAYKRELRRRETVSSMAGDLVGSVQDDILLGGDQWLAEIPVPSAFRDRSLRELDLRRAAGVQVVLVRRRQGAAEGHFEMVPRPDTRLQLGDAIVVMGPKTALQQLRNA